MESLATILYGVLEELRNTYNAIPGTLNEVQRLKAVELIPKLQALCLIDTISESETLDFEDEEFCEFDYGDGEESDDGNDSSQSQEWGVYKMENDSFTVEFMTQVLFYYDTRPKKKFSQTQNRYQRVKDSSYITRFRHYVENFGTAPQKLIELDQRVAQQFFQARLQHLSVHDDDLRRWGIKIAKELKLDFVASRSWCSKFKKRNRIVTRKITKFVSSTEIQTVVAAQELARTFVSECIPTFFTYEHEKILNADQSGFTYEEAPKRTLSIYGEKSTTGIVKSKSKCTHSYTIMPTISLHGNLLSPMLMCLQEVEGKFGPKVEKDIESYKVKYPNIVLVASKSGKMSKELMRKWVEECLTKQYKGRALLLLDAWSGQKDSRIFAEVEESCERLEIPASTTAFAQPLDVYYFRQHKLFRRRIHERVTLDSLPINLTTRENSVKTHSLIFNQLSSPKFYPMLKYAWAACGYIPKAEPFENVLEVCFNVRSKGCDYCEDADPSFMKCSFCDAFLCMKHFFEEFHYH